MNFYSKQKDFFEIARDFLGVKSPSEAIYLVGYSNQTVSFRESNITCIIETGGVGLIMNLDVKILLFKLSFFILSTALQFHGKGGVIHLASEIVEIYWRW